MNYNANRTEIVAISAVITGVVATFVFIGLMFAA